MIYQFGHYEFEPSQQELRDGLSRKTLPTALNKLLLLFVSRPGELVTREQIANALWDQQQETVDTETGTNTAIRRLRSQIGDNYSIFIETVIGAGYRFTEPVTIIRRESANSEQAEDKPVPASWLQRYWPRVLMGSVLLIAIAAAGVFWKLLAARNAASLADNATPDSITQELTPVTYDDLADQLDAQAISPSGKLLAYSDKAGLHIESLSSGDSKLVDSPRNLAIQRIAWFPNESAILLSGAVSGGPNSSIAATTNEVWLVSLAGESPRLLLENALLAVPSPDGHHIAYLRGVQTEIWVSGPNGDFQHKLLSAPNGDNFSCVLWSPQSKRIVTDRFHYGISQLAGTSEHESEHRQNGAAVSSIYESYDANSGALLSQRNGVEFASAALLQNGILIYLVNSSLDPTRVGIAKTDSATGAFLSDPKFLSAKQALGSSVKAARINQLSISADGSAISAILDRDSIDVYTADVANAGSSAVHLENIKQFSHHTVGNYPTAWSADSRSVIFDNWFKGADAVSAQSEDGSRPLVYVHGNAGDDRFAQGRFSPDGSWLLFLHPSKDGKHIDSIERVPATGGQPEVVPTVGPVEAFRCSVSPEGRCVLREADGKSNLVYYALDPIRGQGGELARTPWQPNILGDWSISPDGTTVAAANHDAVHPAVQLIPLASSPVKKSMLAAPREIPVSGFGIVLTPSWFRNGRGFFVETYTPSGYDLLSLTMDGNATLLRQSGDLIWAVPSPDGEKIAFPANTPLNRNVWVGLTRWRKAQ